MALYVATRFPHSFLLKPLYSYYLRKQIFPFGKGRILSALIQYDDQVTK